MTPAFLTDLPPVFDRNEAVCFDAFGTLVEITDKRQAFRPMFKALIPDKRLELKHRLMREDRPFTHWPEALEVEIAPMTLLEVMERMMIETGSIALRPGTADIWARLRSERLRLALCSNLASDYVTALRSAFPETPDLEVLSCKVGAIKPESAIYAAVLDGLQVAPGRVLFAGDTTRVDIQGACVAGMKAIHLDELVAAFQPGRRSGEGRGPPPLGQPHSTAPGPRAQALRAAPLPLNEAASPPPAFATWQICEAKACKSAQG